MKDLKTSIYRILTCSVLVLSLFSCEAEFDLPATPTLSGTYKVEFISATGQNLITGQVIDTMIVAGTFSMKDPIEPLDVLDIGERIHLHMLRYMEDTIFLIWAMNGNMILITTRIKI